MEISAHLRFKYYILVINIILKTVVDMWTNFRPGGGRQLMSPTGRRMDKLLKTQGRFQQLIHTH